MKRKAIVFVIVLSAVSLVGIVFTQLFWVKKSLDLKSEQFDNSVRIALKTVLNQLMDHKNDTVFQQKLILLSCRKPKLEVTDYIDPNLLDSLVRHELASMELDSNFSFGLYNRDGGRFVAGNYAGYQQQLYNSPYQFSVAGIYKPGDYYLSVYFPGKTIFVLRQMEIWLMLSFFFLMVMVFSFVWVAYTIFRQKKLSEMKTDFINNLTHEFKTPMATSSLAAEMLLRPEVIGNEQKVKKYASVILEENVRLQNHVERVLQVAILEKGQLRFKFKKSDVHRLLQTALGSFELKIQQNNIDLKLDLGAARHIVLADRLHLLNVFHNLLDNAIKYTPENPRIEIKTWNDNHHIVIRVQDNGIGIPAGHQKDIFKNLFRVPMGNIHEVRGFGLGLYYVKTVLEHHNGRIELQSQEGVGSSFDVYLPLYDENKKL